MLWHIVKMFFNNNLQIMPIEAGENSRVSRSVSEEARHEPKCDEAWNQLTKNERAHLVSYIKGLSTVRLNLLTYSWCEIVYRLKTLVLLDMFTHRSTGSIHLIAVGLKLYDESFYFNTYLYHDLEKCKCL